MTSAIQQDLGFTLLTHAQGVRFGRLRRRGRLTAGLLGAAVSLGLILALSCSISGAISFKEPAAVQVSLVRLFHPTPASHAHPARESPVQRPIAPADGPRFSSRPTIDQTPATGRMGTPDLVVPPAPIPALQGLGRYLGCNSPSADLTADQRARCRQAGLTAPPSDRTFVLRNAETEKWDAQKAAEQRAPVSAFTPCGGADSGPAGTAYCPNAGSAK